MKLYDPHPFQFGAWTLTCPPQIGARWGDAFQEPARTANHVQTTGFFRVKKEVF
jgi:hypothetical protein